MAILAILMAVGGVVLIVAGEISLRIRRRRLLVEALEVEELASPATTDEEEEPGTLVQGAVQLATRAVDRVDARGALGDALERARIPLRPGEYIIVTAASALAVAAVLLALTRTTVIAVVVLVLTPVASRMFVHRKITKRRRAFEAQLPGALQLVGSSLAAGHTFLRAIQMMCQESDPPLSEEFERVVAETSLGDSVTDAMARVAQRLQVRDLEWVVQAIRIQQTVGGRLAELLQTLSEFIRSRDEVRREVLVLTAEGRMSAWVLGALPPFMLLAIQVINPSYMAPMYRGWGLVALALSGASVLFGVLLIRRMSNIEV